MWFKNGDIAHLNKNVNIFGKRFKYNDSIKIIEVNKKRESYLCEINIRGEIREVELSQKEFVSPEAWKRTIELDKKLKGMGTTIDNNK